MVFQRRINMTLAFLAFLSFVVLTHTVKVAVAEKCRVPNPSTVFCASLPTGAVSSCTNLSPCVGSIYEIENFPDGTIPKKTGATKQIQANCIRSMACYLQIGANGLGTCVAPAQFGAWTPGVKTVTNPDEECPPPEE